MTIETISKQYFLVKNDLLDIVGKLSYEDDSFRIGYFDIDKKFDFHLASIGLWVTKMDTQKICESRVELGGVFSIRYARSKSKFLFKRSTNWKLRFSLYNAVGDELLTMVSSVNWEKESHNFILQLNEDFEKDCNPFIILQALHCANCSLSMMNGGQVPALISL